MKFKVKVRRKVHSCPTTPSKGGKPTQPPPASPESILEANRETLAFLDKANPLRDTPARLRTFLLDHYEAEFGARPKGPISNEVLWLRVGYTILKRGFMERGLRVPSQVRERADKAEKREAYEAAHPECLQQYIIPFATPSHMRHNGSGTRVPSEPETQDRKKEKRTMSKKEVAATSGKRPVGATTGLGVIAAWVHIFEKNQKAPKAKRMTDEQITAWLNQEFPGRDSAIFGRVQSVRARYNSGGLTGGTAPAVASTPFDATGSVVEVKRGRANAGAKVEAPKAQPKALPTPVPTAKKKVVVKKKIAA